MFKVCILILRINEENLLAMSFEEMLKTLVRLPEQYLVGRQMEIRSKFMDSQDESSSKDEEVKAGEE